MIALSTRELYGLFLESNWWQELAERVKALACWECSKCGSKERLQAHHVRYPDNWFDTKESDLVCVCRNCHEQIHGVHSEPPPIRHQKPSIAQRRQQSIRDRLRNLKRKKKKQKKKPFNFYKLSYKKQRQFSKYYGAMYHNRMRW